MSYGPSTDFAQLIKLLQPFFPALITGWKPHHMRRKVVVHRARPSCCKGRQDLAIVGEQHSLAASFVAPFFGIGWQAYLSEEAGEGGIGGGGGSFIDTALLSPGTAIAVSGFNAGNGYVTLDLVSTVPLPAAAPMFGAALAALGVVGYGLKRKRAAAA